MNTTLVRSLTRLQLLSVALGAVLLAAAPAQAAGSYTVKRGDTLYSIARTNGVTVRELVAANGISNPNLIQPGQVLSVPDRGAPAAPAAPRRDANAGSYVVTASGLNVRSGPSTSSSKVGLLKKGAKVSVLGTSGSWRRIAFDGGQAYVHGAYLRSANAAPPARPAPARPAPSRPSEPARPAPTPPRPTVSAPSAPQPDSVRRVSTRRQVGTSKVNANLVRTMISRHGQDSASFETDTSLNLHVINRDFRVIGLRRQVESTGLDKSTPRVRRSFEVTLLNRNRIGISKNWTHSLYVTAFAVPVPVGPFSISVEARVGATLSLSASVPLAWNGRSFPVTYAGSVGVGGTVGVAAGLPLGLAKAGVEGRLDIVRATLPATASLERRTLTFDVDLILSSNLGISVFAQAGLGPFSKRLTASIPFLQFTFAARRYDVASGVIRVGS